MRQGAKLQLEARILQDGRARGDTLGEEIKEVALAPQKEVGDCQCGGSVHARHAVDEHSLALRLHGANKVARRLEAFLKQGEGAVVLGIELQVADALPLVCIDRVLAHAGRTIAYGLYVELGKSLQVGSVATRSDVNWWLAGHAARHVASRGHLPSCAREINGL